MTASPNLQTHINKVGMTSLGMAAARARESRRADALFQDPFAEALAGPANNASPRNSLVQESDEAPYLEIRTRFFDDLLMEIVSVEGVRQVVLLGAGMDARAYRLDWPPDTHLFEVEQSAVLQVKDDILNSLGAKPTCNRLPLGLNIVGDDFETPLVSAGFDPGKPVVWLAEGLSYYLEEESVRKLIETLSSLSVSNSHIAADFVNADFFTSEGTKVWLNHMENFGAPWRFGTNSPEEFLATYGWDSEAIQPGEEPANYGRWKRGFHLRSIPDVPRFFFVRGRRN